MTKVIKIQDILPVKGQGSSDVQMGSIEPREFDATATYNTGDRVYYDIPVEQGLTSVPYFKAKRDGIRGEFNINDWYNNTIDQELAMVHAEQSAHRRKAFSHILNSGVLSTPTTINETNQQNLTWFKEGIASRGVNGVNELLVGMFDAVVAGEMFTVLGDVTISETQNTEFFSALPVKLLDPPTTGHRKDMVVLEVFKKDIPMEKSQLSTSRTEIAYRVRTYPYDKRFSNGVTVLDGSITQHNPLITAQGGNIAPLEAGKLTQFLNSEQRKNPASHIVRVESNNDKSLYIAGDGTDESIELLKTSDGYVYLIPLFLINRRNTSEYSLQNNNGSSVYKEIDVTVLHEGEYFASEHIDMKVSITEGKELVYGDTFKLSTTLELKVIEVAGTTVTFRIMGNGSHSLKVTSGETIEQLRNISSRPDGKYADIITPDDIVDLRHMTSTSSDMKFMLADATNRLFRGELDTNNKYTLTHQQFGIVPAAKAPLIPYSTEHVTIKDTPFKLQNMMGLGSRDIGNFKFDSTVVDVFVRGQYLVMRKIKTSGNVTLDVIINAPVATPVLFGSRTKGNGQKITINSETISTSVNAGENILVRGARSEDGVYTSFTINCDLAEGEEILFSDMYQIPHNKDTAALVQEYIDVPYFTSVPNIISSLLDIEKTKLAYNKRMVGDVNTNTLEEDESAESMEWTYISTGIAESGGVFMSHLNNSLRVPDDINTLYIHNPLRLGVDVIELGKMGKVVGYTRNVTNVIRKNPDTTHIELNIRSLNYMDIASVTVTSAPISAPFGRWVVPKTYFLLNAPSLIPGNDRVYNTANAVSTERLIVRPKNYNTDMLDVTVKVEDTWTVGDTITCINPTKGSILEPAIITDGLQGNWTDIGSNRVTFTITEVTDGDVSDTVVTFTNSLPPGRGLYTTPDKVELVKLNDIEYRKSNMLQITTTMDETPLHKIYSGDSLDTLVEVLGKSDAVSKVNNKTIETVVTETNRSAIQKYSVDLAQSVRNQYGHSLIDNHMNILDSLSDLQAVIEITWVGKVTNGFNNKGTLSIGDEVKSFDTSEDTRVSMSVKADKLSPAYVLDFVVSSDSTDGSTKAKVVTDYVEVSIVTPIVDSKGRDIYVPKSSRVESVLSAKNTPKNLNILPIFTSSIWDIDVGSKGKITPTELLVEKTGKVSITFDICPNEKYVLQYVKPDVSTVAEPTITISLKNTNTELEDLVITNTSNVTAFDTRHGDRTATLVITNTSSEEINALVKELSLVKGVGTFDYTINMTDNVTRINLPNVSGDELSGYHLVYNSTKDGQVLKGKLTDKPFTMREVENLKVSEGIVVNSTVSVDGESPAHLFVFELSKYINVENLDRFTNIMTLTWNGKVDGGATVEALLDEEGTVVEIGTIESSEMDSNVIVIDKPEVLASIMARGVVSFIVRAKSVVTSGEEVSIMTDAVKFTVGLTKESSYIKKNIILIDKQSRELTTLFSTRHDITNQHDVIDVYFSHLPCEDINETTELTILSEGDDVLITDIGLDNIHVNTNHHYANPLHYIGVNMDNLHGDLGFVTAPYAADSKDINIGSRIRINKDGLVDGFNNQVTIPLINKPMVGIFRYLVNHGGVIKLLVVASKSNNGKVELYSHTNNTVKLYNIPGNPTCTKQGVRRVTNKTNTSLMTPTGTIQGYLDDQGRLVATYQ